MLSLVYLETGLLFLWLTRSSAWRLSFPHLLANLRKPRAKPSADKRHVAHKDAFLAACAAAIGVGNLAGVGTAIHLGGPGALFWMWMSAILGTSFRMTSTYLAIKYADKDTSPRVFATPMLYLEKFLPEPFRNIAWMLAGLLLVKGMVTANLIQANSVAHALGNHLGLPNLVVAVGLATVVGAVIIGGLRSIVLVSAAIAPWMVAGYVALGLVILGTDPARTLHAINMVFTYAFTPFSAAGGVIGYTVMQAMQFGVSRGVFTHNAGMGVAPFLQSANDDHPARGALMASFVPLVDTVLVCTITGLVLLSTGLWSQYTGAYLAVTAFETAMGDAGRIAVTLCLFVFAFSTIIGWAHFSERCFEYLGGTNLIGYRWFFTGVTFCGPFLPVGFIWSVGDVLIGLIIIVHLLPLTYIMLKTRTTMLRDLWSVAGRDS